MINLSDIVRKVIDKTSHASRNTQLISDLHEGKIYADKNQIEVLAQHLILNAFEAVPCEAGKITVRVAVQFASENYLAESLTPGRFETGTYLALEISDNGFGIPRETREKIFQPFFSSKPLHRGLGLAVADGIIRRHNAALLLSSEEGKGTTIRVLFPWKE